MKRLFYLCLFLFLSTTGFAADTAVLQDASGNVQGTSANPLHVTLSGGGGGTNFPPNVGIGSASPGQALDVVGTLRVSGVILSSSIDADQVFNVKSYGAKGDGIHGTDGAITSGLSAFTSAAAAFTANDVGKVIVIVGAGAAGVDLTTTISAFVSATAVTLTAAAGSTVSGKDYSYGTDDTTAIQNAITAAGAVSGTVFSPKGLYIINGAFGTNPNSQLALPNVLLTSPGQSIEILGQNFRETQYSYAPDTNGSIWFFTKNGTSSQSGLGIYGTSLVGGAFHFSNINVTLRKMTFRTVTNPTSSAVDLSQAQQASGQYLQIDHDYTMGTNYANAVQPTGTGSYGLLTPALDNFSNSNWDYIQITNYYTGMTLGEHAVANHSAVYLCNFGVEIPQAAHTRTIEYIDLERNIYNLNFTNNQAAVNTTGNVNIYMMDIEHDSFGAGGWTATVDDIYDPNNYGVGVIVYNSISTFLINGGTNLNLIDGKAGIVTFGLTGGFSGNIGIGTTNPQAPISILANNSSNSVPIGLITKNTNNNGKAQIQVINDNSKILDLSSFGSNIGAVFLGNRVSVFSDSSPMTIGTDINVTSGGGDPLNFLIGGYNQTATMSLTAGAPGNVGIGTVGPSSLFEVGVRKLDILSGGNVGISSLTPGQLLDVQGTERASNYSGMTTMANWLTPLQVKGTTFTISGCSASAPAGGATTGTFTSGTTGTCTVVVTFNGATGSTAANGWNCDGVADQTTIPALFTGLMHQTASSTTTCTVSGTTVTNDVITINGVPY